MDEKLNRASNFIPKAIKKMGEIIGTDDLTIEYCNENEQKIQSGIIVDPWFVEFFWVESQERVFRDWFIDEYSKTFNVNKYKGKYSADKAFNWFNLKYGLTRSDIEDNRFNEQEE